MRSTPSLHHGLRPGIVAEYWTPEHGSRSRSPPPARTRPMDTTYTSLEHLAVHLTHLWRLRVLLLETALHQSALTSHTPRNMPVSQDSYLFLIFNSSTSEDSILLRLRDHMAHPAVYSGTQERLPPTIRGMDSERVGRADQAQKLTRAPGLRTNPSLHA